MLPLFCFSLSFLEFLSFVNPGLDADHSIGGMRLSTGEIDIGAERMEGDLPAGQPFATGHFSAAQAAADLDFHALHRLVGLPLIEHPFQDAPERQTLLQLFRYLLAHQHRVGLRALHFLDFHLELDFFAGKKLLLDGAGQIFDAGTAATDEHARTGRVDDQPDGVRGTLDLHRSDSGRLPLAHNERAHLYVLAQLLPIHFLTPEPARLPVGRNAETDASWIDFIAHND